jgi:hypothetical protein
MGLLHRTLIVKAVTADTTHDIGEVVGGPLSVEAQLVSAAPTAGTSPTLLVKIQSSLDNTNWTDLITFTGQTSAAVSERKTAVESASVHIGRYFRVSYDIGGTDDPAYNPYLAVDFKE